MEFLLGPAALVAGFVGISLWLPTDDVVFNQISVPAAYQDLGYSGSVVTTLLSEDIREIDRLAGSNAVEDNEVDTQIEELEDYFEVAKPVTLVSGLIKRDVMGDRPHRVGGQITDDGDSYTFELRVVLRDGTPSSSLIRQKKADANIRQMIRQAAEAATKAVDPYTLAAYYYYVEKPQKVFAKTVETLLYCIGRLKPEERHQPYNLWGRILLAKGDSTQAIDKFKKSLELKPEFSPAWLNWGIALAEQKQYDQAVEKFQQALAANSNFAPAYSEWGAMLAEQGKHDEAIAKFQKAATADPAFDDVHARWGDLLVKLNRHQEAFVQYSQALALDPDDPIYAERVRETLRLINPATAALVGK
ncbi:MAG: tetratricopeptide repeat protein [Azospirillum sp.]|nr:tetratricopeptide repeat protein [Azospirillum sp.]